MDWTNRLLALAAAPLLFAAGQGFGDEPAKHDLARAIRWQAGDALRRTETIDFGSANHYWVTGGSAGDDDFTFRSEAVWEERCLEADAEGRPVRLEVRIETWSWTGGKVLKADTTLAGRTLLVEGVGAKRKAALQGAATTAQGPTLWIALHFGAGEGLPGLGRLLPQEPVAVGATWSGDLAGLARAALDFEPHTEKATGEARLASVDEQGLARITWKAEVPTKGYAKPPIPWTKDGTAHLEGEFALSTGSRLPLGSERWTAVVEGEATDKNVNYRIRKRIEVERTAEPSTGAAQQPAEEGTK